jgi:hypothetical protein
VIQIDEWREAVGLSVPLWEEKLHLWSGVSISSAETSVTKETGGYKPNLLVAYFLKHPAVAKLLAGGPRSGKSLGMAMDLLTWTPHANLIWLVAETYEGSRREFGYLADGLDSLRLVRPSSISFSRRKDEPCSMETKWGCLIETKSLADQRRIAAYGPDVIAVCEPGLLTQDIVWRFRERLSGRRGLLLMAGSFEEDTGWMARLWEEWKHWPEAEGKSFICPSWLNRNLYPGGKDDPAIQGMRRNMTRHQFLLRVAGVPTMPPEVIFSGCFDPDFRRETSQVRRFDRRRILEDPNILVEITVDPGYSSGVYAVHPIAWDGRQACAFDEIRREGALHSEIIGRAMSSWWWHRVSGGTLDPYAGSHHIFGSSSPQEVWQREAHLHLRTDYRVGVEDGIERHRWFLRDPITGEARLLVDPCCQGLIQEYQSWRRTRIPEGADRRSKPHERGCDSIKAITAWLVDCYMRRMRPQQQLGIRLLGRQRGHAVSWR